MVHGCGGETHGNHKVSIHLRTTENHKTEHRKKALGGPKALGGRKCRHEQGSKRIVTVNDYIRLIESLEQFYLSYNSSVKSKKKGMKHAFITPTSQMRKQTLRHINEVTYPKSHPSAQLQNLFS